MRDIKFRMWDGHNKSYLGENKDATYYLPRLKSTDTCLFFETEDSDYVIEQYTGLKDKNGKEIYEGDILEVKNNFGQVIDKREVVFKELSDDVEGYVINIGIGFNVNKLSAVESKVIGNIHEHSHLLEITK